MESINKLLNVVTRRGRGYVAIHSDATGNWTVTVISKNTCLYKSPTDSDLAELCNDAYAVVKDMIALK